MTAVQSLLQSLETLSIESAKISLSRDEQFKDVEPEKVAQALYNKYYAARLYLTDLAMPILEKHVDDSIG